ncbi:hypothetical protein BACCIP111895_03131 [Neobacillus rhizosphaerae]|uniref:Uncharacterized protein n=1 Tax=Neobacillus rhizosphaerae TaxID=2880965 RepID=A0ABM9ETG3_9BACI|nr:hypothetical protein [Neobacillus rhizosphaerae]CAH2715947.1 hypothetical protein BACCIP111895_03131 [Neobacillus rhizosphaerae]
MLEGNIERSKNISHKFNSKSEVIVLVWLSVYYLMSFQQVGRKGFGVKKETLYDILKQLSDGFFKICDVEISPETEEVINFTRQNRKNAFENFEQQKGNHLFIEGEITAKSFDPMNIVPFEDRLLHKNFIKVGINNEDYLVQQPVIVNCKGGLQNIIKLHLILKNNPIENIDSLTIGDIGVIKGRIEKKKNVLHLYVN